MKKKELYPWKPTKINDAWVMSTIIKDCIATREMKRWEKILYWRKIYGNYTFKKV